jgi:hypothetical protein
MWANAIVPRRDHPVELGGPDVANPIASFGLVRRRKESSAPAPARCWRTTGAAKLGRLPLHAAWRPLSGSPRGRGCCCELGRDWLLPVEGGRLFERRLVGAFTCA